MADSGSTVDQTGTGSVRSRSSEELLRDAGLPVNTLREALPHLRRPFTPEAIRFKVQTVFSGNSGCIVVAYIDARLVIDRLNAVCGDAWSARPLTTQDQKHMWCELTVFDRTRIDLGQSGKGFSKDLWSDAIKRSAVQFGIGVSVYALPEIKLFMKESHGRLELRGKGDRQTVALTDHGHVKLREGYAGWLENHGARLFGAALDHGDVEGSTFDDSEQEDEQFVPEVAPPLDDDEAHRLMEATKAVYAQIQALGEGAVKEIPPARFNAWLTGASHSHVELERLRAHLAERLPHMTAKYGGGAA